MVWFGHAAFFGLGMYGAAAALLMVRPPNLWLAIVYGLVGSAGITLFLAYFSTWARHIYLPIPTLVFFPVFFLLILSLTHATRGAYRPPLHPPSAGPSAPVSVPF